MQKKIVEKNPFLYLLVTEILFWKGSSLEDPNGDEVSS